jgi:hypothetical protein
MATAYRPFAALAANAPCPRKSNGQTFTVRVSTVTVASELLTPGC